LAHAWLAGGRTPRGRREWRRTQPTSRRDEVGTPRRCLDGDALKVRGRLYARGSEIPLEIDAKINQIEGELEIEAATNASHRELGMTLNLLGTIRPHSRLLVKGRLTRSGRTATRERAAA
jgi:hypothetical protein